MPINIIPEECAACGEEITVFVRASSCGHANVIAVSCSCVACDERKAAEKSETPDLRSDEAVGSGGDESGDVVSEEKEINHIYQLVGRRRKP